MNLDKYIRIMLTKLSKKYKVTIVEIIVGKNEKVSKNYTVSLERIYRDKLYKTTEKFNSKRQLASWLMCQK